MNRHAAGPLKLILLVWSPSTLQRTEAEELAAVLVHLRHIHDHLRIGLESVLVWRPDPADIERLRFCLSHGTCTDVREACWTGWGAFNLNSYFLYTKAAGFQDNFGKNKWWRQRFAEVVGNVRGAHRAAAIIPDLGSDSFATREAAAQELRTIGTPALAALYSAAGSTDLEMRRRAEGIIRAITKSNEPQ